MTSYSQVVIGSEAVKKSISLAFNLLKSAAIKISINDSENSFAIPIEGTQGGYHIFLEIDGNLVGYHEYIDKYLEGRKGIRVSHDGDYVTITLIPDFTHQKNADAKAVNVYNCGAYSCTAAKNFYHRDGD